MKDLHSHIAVVNALGPISLAADTTSAAIDLQGYRSVEILIGLGIQGVTLSDTDKIDIKITHSDDDSTYTAVEAADILGETSIGSGGIVKSFNAPHAAAAQYRVGYVGGKRYVKAQADFSGTHGTATPIAIAVLKGHPLNGPVAADI